MGKYVVGVKEVYVVNIPVELTDSEEQLSVLDKIERIKGKAKKKVEQEETMGEYSYTTDVDEWSVSRVK